MGSSSSKSGHRVPKSRSTTDKNVGHPSPASHPESQTMPPVDNPDTGCCACSRHENSPKNHKLEAFSNQRNVKSPVIEVKPLNVTESLQNPLFDFPAKPEVEINEHPPGRLLLRPLAPGRLGLGAIDIKTELIQDGILDRAAISQYQSEDIIRDLRQTGIISKRSEKFGSAQGEPTRFVRLAPISELNESESIKKNNKPVSEMDEVCASSSSDSVEGAVGQDGYAQEYSRLSIANKIRDVDLI